MTSWSLCCGGIMVRASFASRYGFDNRWLILALPLFDKLVLCISAAGVCCCDKGKSCHVSVSATVHAILAIHCQFLLNNNCIYYCIYWYFQCLNVLLCLLVALSAAWRWPYCTRTRTYQRTSPSDKGRM